MRENLEWYDVHITFTLNPFNWELGVEKYYNWGLHLKFGPVSALLLRPGNRKVRKP